MMELDQTFVRMENELKAKKAQTRADRAILERRIVKSLFDGRADVPALIDAMGIGLAGFVDVVRGRSRNPEHQYLLYHAVGLQPLELFGDAMHVLLRTKAGRECVKHRIALRKEVSRAMTKAKIASPGELAKRLGCGLPTLSNVMSCRYRTQHVQKALAKFCHTAPQKLFGAFTHPDLVTNASLKETA